MIHVNKRSRQIVLRCGNGPNHSIIDPAQRAHSDYSSSQLYSSSTRDSGRLYLYSRRKMDGRIDG